MNKFLIVHTTDHHHGLTTDGVEDVNSGLNTRTLDSFYAFDQVIQFCIDNNVKVLTISGDIFDNKSVPQNIINAFYERLQRLSQSNIFTYILLGNHDISARESRKSSLEIAKILNMPNVYVTRGNDPVLDLGYIQIYSPSYWDNNEVLEQKITQAASTIDWTRPALLVVHCQVETPQFKYSSFKEDLHFTPLSLLIKNPWVYVAMGHLHRYVKLNDNPPVYYGGSLVRCSFSEEYDDKGFNVIEVDGIKPVKVTRQNVDCLKMRTYKGTMADIRAALTKTQPEQFQNTIIRATIDTTDEEIDDKFLKTIFAQAFKFRVTKAPKTRELKKMDAIGLNTLNKYAEKYFENEPRKIELMALLDEIKKTEESKA